MVLETTVIVGALQLITEVSKALEAYHAGTATDEQLDVLRATSQGVKDGLDAAIERAKARAGQQ